MRVQQHLRFVEQRVAGRRLIGQARAPVPWLASSHLELSREVARQRVAQGIGLGLRQDHRIGRRRRHMVAHHAQMRRVGARPARLAGIAAAGEQREGAGGKRCVAELERVLQPLLHGAGVAVLPPRPGQKQLERGEPGLRAGAEQPGNDELAVHQAASGTTRTPRLPRWRARMR